MSLREQILRGEKADGSVRDLGNLDAVEPLYIQTLRAKAC